MSGLIKWFSSDDTGSPVLSNAWDIVTDLLDTCLVTGYNHRAIASVAISSGVATLTFNTNHSYKQFQVINITGSIYNALNSEFKILGVTTNTVEFEVELPDLIETGTLSASLAPLGWSKPFSDLGKAVYQAKNFAENPFYLRVDGTKDPIYPETYTRFAKVGILESCIGIDDILGTQSPFNQSAPDRNWVGQGAYGGWAKWKYAIGDGSISDSVTPAAGVRQWFLVGDDSTFYLVIRASTNTNFEIPYGFGAIQTNGAPKPFLLSEMSYNAWNNNISATTPLTTPAQQWVASLYDYTGTLANTTSFKLISGFGNVSSGATANATKPDPTFGYHLSPFYMVDPNNYILGELPLVQCCINNATSEVSGAMYQGDGVNYMIRRYRTQFSSTATQGALFFKIYEG
ncbi:hypothetical protein [Acinetobacter sp. YH12145]|uniref:hypothetical protein n=1 Tax=Acinetobacter sp. YH12145 TaxID=2601129 RepID=UPI0015D2732C|nr:hypothetical protein [Acinetobacter sp. YH12145]